MVAKTPSQVKNLISHAFIRLMTQKKWETDNAVEYKDDEKQLKVIFIPKGEKDKKGTCLVYSMKIGVWMANFSLLNGRLGTVSSPKNVMDLKTMKNYASKERLIPGLDYTANLLKTKDQTNLADEITNDETIGDTDGTEIIGYGE